MGKVDPKRLLIIVFVLGALMIGYYYFSPNEESPSPGALLKTQSTPQPQSATKLREGAALPEKQPKLYPPPAADKPAQPMESPNNQAIAKAPALSEAQKELKPETLLSARQAALPDPFKGTTAEVIKLRKEAEILEAKIKILDLKAKQAEAELKEKRARSLAAMIDKDPRVLFSLPADMKEGAILPTTHLGPPDLGAIRGDPKEAKGDLEEIIRGRYPTVRMIILGHDKRITVEYRGSTFTLSIGDKVQDLEVINVTQRGGLFRINGKQEFIPVTENTREEVKTGEKPATNTNR